MMPKRQRNSSVLDVVPISETLGLSAHGLRKATCRRLAEAGCSANQIAAISGHATLREVERYTKAASQDHLAALRFLPEAR
jgi:integrase